jgi:hypothetical protein
MLRDIEQWFHRKVPAAWFAAPPDVKVDNDEVLVVGVLQTDKREPALRIRDFREETREQRMRIAAEAEQRFGRAVSWGARCGELRILFTTYSVPVMTRLRMPEREVLDTLIAANVARTRSDALAWCVRLVSEHEGDWLAQLNDALVHVQKVRDAGPKPR